MGVYARIAAKRPAIPATPNALTFSAALEDVAAVPEEEVVEPEPEPLDAEVAAGEPVLAAAESEEMLDAAAVPDEAAAVEALEPNKLASPRTPFWTPLGGEDLPAEPAAVVY